MAKLVASRKKGRITVLKVEAQEAFKDGVVFYKEEDNIWLSEPISSKYVCF